MSLGLDLAGESLMIFVVDSRKNSKQKLSARDLTQIREESSQFAVLQEGSKSFWHVIYTEKGGKAICCFA